MLSRTLALATVTLLMAGFAAAPALAQNQNLEAGKSPSQIFAGTCTACHKGPRGLLRTVPSGSLQGYLRQHYTTSPEMASLLAGFLVSNGAADTRHVADQPKSGRGEKPETRPGGAPEQLDRFGRRLRTTPPQDAKLESEPASSKPDADGISEGGRQGRNAKRSVRPGEPTPEGQAPAQASSERGSAKQKLGRRSKPLQEEPPKTDAAKIDNAKEEAAKTEPGQNETPTGEVAKEAGKLEAAKSDAAKSDTAKSDTAKSDTAKSDGRPDRANADGGKADNAKPVSDSGKSESARIESPSDATKPETAESRPDAVPAGVSASVTGATPEPPAQQSSPKTEPPRAIAASAPPPVAPAGPPAPPISQ
jgi:hypothetical protein